MPLRALPASLASRCAPPRHFASECRRVRTCGRTHERTTNERTDGRTERASGIAADQPARLRVQQPLRGVALSLSARLDAAASDTGERPTPREIADRDAHAHARSRERARAPRRRSGGEVSVPRARTSSTRATDRSLVTHRARRVVRDSGYRESCSCVKRYSPFSRASRIALRRTPSALRREEARWTFVDVEGPVAP